METHYQVQNNRNAVRVRATKVEAEQQRSESEEHLKDDADCRAEAIERMIEAKVAMALRLLSP